MLRALSQATMDLSKRPLSALNSSTGVLPKLASVDYIKAVALLAVCALPGRSQKLATRR